jgi:hypothetical protein
MREALAIDLGDSLALRRRQFEGQGVQRLAAKFLRGFQRASGPCAQSLACQRQRQLVRQQFVIGQSSPRRCVGDEVRLGRGCVRLPQRIRKGGPFFARPERGILPFR